MTLPSNVSAELFRAIAEYTYDWESWVDESGATRWINPAVERISGYTVDECLAREDYPLFMAYPSDRAMLHSVLDDAEQGGSGNDVEFRIVMKHGGVRWVAISWQAVRSVESEALGYRTSVRDIDHRKRIEEELHTIRRKAEELALARSELLANVSHELRSPAHCIAGFAELLLQDRLPPTQRRYVELIAEQCRSMLRQVEDLLSLTALEAGGVELERAPLHVGQLCQGLIDALRQVAGQRGVALEGEIALGEVWVEGDALRLRQVLQNLLDNAIKFTERGAVTLRAYEQRQGSSRLIFEVIDTGPGIPAEQIESLRLPFRQGDASSSRRHGGVGLGLAIVDRLVKAMQGELSIHSELGRGTRVRVSLPLHVSTPPLARETGKPTPSRAGGRALIVDDSPAARELLGNMLQRCGYESTAAESAAQALQIAGEQALDVVFLDYQMPDSDGSEAASALRRVLDAHLPTRRVPIYILTANVFVREQLRSAHVLVDGILTKPLSLSALGNVLAQLPGKEPAQVTQEAGALDAELVQELLTMRARNGQSMLAKLLPQVELEVERSLAALHDALDRGDSTQAARAAHAIAGQTALVGALAARDQARELEAVLSAQPALATVAQRAVSITRAWAEARVLLRSKL